MKTVRIVEPGKGCFGLFAIIESRRVVLPLKGVECEFSVRGGVAEVSLSQIFRQENPQPLDCEYLFPLPADASVYSCEADINGRIIRAEIKERAEARKIVAEKKAEGFRTALVESERDNLFTLGLGNVQPDDLIIVRLKYFQTLRAIGETRAVEIPFCPGVRYIPGTPLLHSNHGKGIVDDTNEVPDASRITPVRIDSAHPDAAYVDVRGSLDAEYVDRQSVVSPSHAVESQISGGQLRVALSSKGEVPDRDFVLRWSERNADTVAPRAWVRESASESYALLEVRAPKQQAAAQPTALDFYFLVDRSGSMRGPKWDKAVEALHSCLNVLGPGDRAMVTLFETNFMDFAEGPLPVRELIEDRQFQNLQRLGTGGGTNLAPALEHVLAIARKKSQGRDHNLILITDAQIGNESAILDLMKTAPDMPVHCFGIDIALNDALLLALSRQQGGTFHSLNPNDNIGAAVTGLGKTLRQPVLLNLQLSEGWESADARVPNLYSGQILYLSAKGAAQKPLSLTARTSVGESVRLDFQCEPVKQEAPRLHWCKTRLQRLLAEGHSREAIALSVASNLLCPLTAFVAWDESEKVTVARHELVQPSMDLCQLSAAPGRAGLLSRMPFQKMRAMTGFKEVAPVMARPFGRSSNAAGLTERSLPPDPEPAQEFRDLCQRLGVDDWQALAKIIEEWLSHVSGNEFLKRTESLTRLLEKLWAYHELLTLLGDGKGEWNGLRLKRLRVWGLQFRRLQQVWKGPASELKGLETLFRRAETLATSASGEQLAQLAAEVRQHAIETVKSFVEPLLTRK